MNQIEESCCSCYNDAMTIKHTLTSLFFSLLVSGVAYAAGAPANVSNVQGAMIDGRLTVTWDPPANTADAVSYRIYYSHQSILGNEGNYDDFVETNDAASSYVFDDLPLASPVIFLGVLAVNKDGMESEGFEVEASVPVPADIIPASVQEQETASSPTSSPEKTSSSSAAPPPTPAPLVITIAEAEGETGALLTFNKAVSASSPLTPLFFQISDTGGTLLPIFAVTQPDASRAVLSTSAQRPDTTYLIKITAPITAEDGGTTPPNTELFFRSNLAAPTASPVTTDIMPSVPEPASDEGIYGRNPLLPPPPPTATLVTVPIRTNEFTGDLPDSGLGLLGVFLAAGGVAGRMIGRRKSHQR